MTNLDSVLKSRDNTLSTKIHMVKAMFFSVVMYGYESWAIREAERQRIDAFKTVMLEKTLESPLDCKEIKPVNSKGNQFWIFIGKTDAEAPIFWPPNAKSWLIRKNPDAGKDWKQEKGMIEDKMVGWHYWLSGHEFEQTPGDDKGLGSLACCSLWGCRELDTTEWLNNNRSFHFSGISVQGAQLLGKWWLYMCWVVWVNLSEYYVITLPWSYSQSWHLQLIMNWPHLISSTCFSDQG